MANGKNETTAITVAGQRRALPLAPETTDDAWRMAEALSKSSMIPDYLRGKPSDVFALVMLGHEIGLGPMQALRMVHVIKGKPQASAECMVALCKQHREVCNYFKLIDEESGPTKATYITHRAGEPGPTKLTYTIEEAKRAGYTNNDNWVKQPAAMLRARASSALARAVYPDLVQGLYSYEEMPPEDAPGTVSAVQAPRTIADLTARLAKPEPKVVEVAHGEYAPAPDEPAEHEPGDDVELP